MMRIEVRQLGGNPPAGPLAAEFDEMGGSIGRSEGNTLMLPDEKRYISRTQASIAFRGGSYVLRDHGSATPTLVNGAVVGNGNEVALKGGDEIRIGDYVLAVSGESAALAPDQNADPFADLLPAAPAHPPAPASPDALRIPSPSRHADVFEDPFALPAPGAKPEPPREQGVIPQDFDPFGDLAPARHATPATPLSDLGLSAAPDQSLDDLFGLKSGSDWDPLAADSVSPAGGAGLSADPLAGLVPQPAMPASPVQRDDAPMLSGAFRMPQPKSGNLDQPHAALPADFGVDTLAAVPADFDAPASAAVPSDFGAPASAQVPDDVFVSWDEPPAAGAGGVIKSVVLASPKNAAPASPRARESAKDAADPDALLAAFLSGADMPDLDIPGGMTPELMTLVGGLMRESIRGTLDLLVARALTKREVRAQATVIIARDNNPLKFSPTVEAALTHLLAPQNAGFMGPTRAVRDAYNDLRSHQFGFMAGMRAALEGVLARFDPARLEQRVEQKPGMFGGGASARKVKLWELYEQLYRDISREAEDDFHTLFGREFLRAYEAQIEKLEQDDAANER